ncbi:MAG: hypothetical protein ABI977_06305 [Acidobacteriota bacterium]
MLEEKLRQKILTVAQAEANTRGWPWLEPVAVEATRIAGQEAWAVRTNVYARGCNIHILIRASDLTVVETGFLPR